MKNYLCINGKKTELTKEQLKQIGITAPLATLDGEIAKVGDYEFIVLENDGQTVKLLLKRMLGKDVAFGDTNDFKTSKVKKILEDFTLEVEKLVGVNNLIEHTVDLTSLDGLKCRGETKAKISLLTVAQYQKYVEKLDEHKYGGWWWLATPWSTPKHGYNRGQTCVSPSGSINYHISIYSGYGVRPFCILKSTIFES